MKWIFGRAAMWMWATFAVATMAFAAVQNVQLPDGDGKKILQTACTACHGLDGIVNLHLDKDGWEGLVASMVSNGAQVDTKDYPVLVDYLVKNFGPANRQVRLRRPPRAATPTPPRRRFSKIHARHVMIWISYPISTCRKTNGSRSLSPWSQKAQA